MTDAGRTPVIPAAMPVRKLSRLGNELYLTSTMAVGRLVPGHYDWGVVLVHLLGRCARDWLDGGAIGVPARLMRSMSVNAMAQSLGKPYATIHRHVSGLVDSGMVVPLDGGFAVSNDAATAPAISALLTLAHDTLVRLADDLHPNMAFAAPASERARLLSMHMTQAALDIWLIPHEYAAKPVHDWLTMFVWITIVVANVRHIQLDPVSSERYAVNPTPDALRRPVSTRRLARITGISYGTVHRHCRTLAAMDVIAYDRGGWLIVSRQLFDDEVDQGVHALLGYFRKRISEMAAYGFDPDRAASFYLAGRPPYVALER